MTLFSRREALYETHRTDGAQCYPDVLGTSDPFEEVVRRTGYYLTDSVYLLRHGLVLLSGGREPILTDRDSAADARITAVLSVKSGAASLLVGRKPFERDFGCAETAAELTAGRLCVCARTVLLGIVKRGEMPSARTGVLTLSGLRLSAPDLFDVFLVDADGSRRVCPVYEEKEAFR